MKGEVLQQLQARLGDSSHYFTSYKEVQRWLEENHGICLSYGYVHQVVRYQLGAKLKVVRKSNLKKDPIYEQKYKKS